MVVTPYSGTAFARIAAGAPAALAAVKPAVLTGDGMV